MLSRLLKAVTVEPDRCPERSSLQLAIQEVDLRPAANAAEESCERKDAFEAHNCKMPPWQHPFQKFTGKRV